MLTFEDTPHPSLGFWVCGFLRATFLSLERGFSFPRCNSSLQENCAWILLLLNASSGTLTNGTTNLRNLIVAFLLYLLLRFSNIGFCQEAPLFHEERAFQSSLSPRQASSSAEPEGEETHESERR